MQLFIGSATQHNDLKRYRKAGFTLREWKAEPGRLPKLSKLRAVRAEAPEELRFSVLLPPQVLLNPGGEEESFAVKAVAAANPHWVVIRGGAQFRPSPAAERQLREAVARLQLSTSSGADSQDELRFAWEPGGLWEATRAVGLAAELGITCVQDFRNVALMPGADVAYLRWKQLGTQSRPNEFAVQDLLESLSSVSELFVAVDGQNASRAARLMREHLREQEGADAELDGLLDELDEEGSEEDDS